MSQITIDRAVVEQALEALFMYKPMVTGVTFKHGQDAIKALRRALEQPQVKQEPIRWPANASEVRAFLSGHVAAERYARDDHQPDDSDTYTLSAHDLLGAIYWWTDSDPQPARQPLTDKQITELADAHMGAFAQFVGAGEVWFEGEKEFARAIEAAHGIKEQK